MELQSKALGSKVQFRERGVREVAFVCGLQGVTSLTQMWSSVGGEGWREEQE